MAIQYGYNGISSTNFFILQSVSCLSKRSWGLRLRLTPAAVASPWMRQGKIEHIHFFIVHITWCILFLHRFENSTNGLFSEVINEKDWWQKLYYTQNIISFAYFQSCFKTGKSHGIGDEDRIPVSIHRRPHIGKLCGIRGI